MRTRAIYTLAASLALVLALSFLLMSDVIPRAVLLKGDSGNPIVFKTRQTHGLLMAYGAFLFAQLALAAATRRARIAWSVLALLAAANGLLVVPGATGYLVLGALVLYLGFVWQGWRGIALALCAGAAAVIVLISVPGPFKERVHRIQDEIVQWQPGVANEVSSVGTRLEFYRVSLKVVANRPFLGHGTGSFAAAFAENTRGQDVVQSGNPHNEYLHIMVQLGLVGLAGLFILFWTHWQLAPALATPLERHLARGLLLAMLVGCLFNSWLMDHVEGLHYAWLTGLLFAGRKSPDRVMRPPSPVTVSG
jgi:O-antigen ligase